MTSQEWLVMASDCGTFWQKMSKFVQFFRSTANLRKEEGGTERGKESRFTSSMWNKILIFLRSFPSPSSLSHSVFLVLLIRFGSVFPPCSSPCPLCFKEGTLSHRPQARPMLCSVCLSRIGFGCLQINLQFPSGSVFVYSQRFRGKLAVLCLISSEQSSFDLPTQTCVQH